jgi:hypothetical protein
MPLQPRLIGPLGLLVAVAGFFAGSWLWAPVGRAELETPAVLAPTALPKLAHCAYELENLSFCASI